MIVIGKTNYYPLAMRSLFLTSLFLISCLSLFSQNKSLENKYIEYFENTREIPYLHLNKTSFIKGEEIWLKSYILEQNSQELHKTTSNLYVSIFDDDGKLKDQKLFRITDGLGMGSIKIDSTFTKETYFLKASTNWMKNFHEDNSYIQKIEIVSNKRKPTINNFSQDKFYEFKLFPEGGHILAETINNLGILIKDKNNKGISISKGVIKNIKGDIIKEFKTNRFGLGDVNLLVRENEIYSFEATLENGIVISQKTPIQNKKGVTMRVINSNPENLFIKVRTNKKSLENLASKKYTIFVHNTREYQKREFTFNREDIIYSLIIDKKKLAKGVNTITVFNENFEPILERIIYNHKAELYSDVSIHKISSTVDSLTFQIKNKSDQKLFLSSSFLPSQTKSYNPNSSIYSAFIFKPYIKGNIQNIDYYLNNTNHKKLRDLDLLLLTQGWSKYSWNNIFNSPPDTNYQFENGITVKGKLNKTLKKDEQLLIFSAKNNIVQVFESGINSFELANTFIKEGTYLRFGITKKDNPVYRQAPSLQFSKRTLYDDLSEDYIDNTANIKELYYEIKDLASTFKETEILDEVEVRKKRDYVDNSLAPYGAATILTRQKMKNLVFASSENVLDFLSSKRYTISYEEGDPIIYPRGGCPLKTNDYIMRPLVRLFLDNFEIPTWVAQSMYLDSVKEVYFGRVNDNRSCEHVYIYTYNPGDYSFRESSYADYYIDKGFSKTKEYYSPEFYTYSGDTFRHFGSIFWIPEISIAPNSVETFKIPTKLQNDVKMHLEGISESGNLISKKIIIN